MIILKSLKAPMAFVTVDVDKPIAVYAEQNERLNNGQWEKEPGYDIWVMHGGERNVIIHVDAEEDAMDLINNIYNFLYKSAEEEMMI